MKNSEVLSLQSAVCKLWDWLKTVEGSQHASAACCDANLARVRAQRSQIPVQPGHEVSLAWLRAQNHAQKLYFRSRDDSFEIAAVGFAHVSSTHHFTKEVHLDLISILNPQHPQMKFYGASRFDSRTEGQTTSEWEPFSCFTFVLPAVELYRDHEGQFCLAANYYPPAGATKIFEALSVIQPLSVFMQTARHSSLLPRAVEVIDSPGFESWDSAMKRILDDLQRDEYQKIVLAHRKKFVFHKSSQPDPVHILAALDETNRTRHITTTHALNGTGPNRTPSTRDQTVCNPRSIGDDGDISEEACDVQRSYLFCLQMAAGKAFISRTPEMLFRLEGRELRTEALAGTVRRGSDEKEAMELKQLLNKKNLGEHGYVVDHISNILSECNVDIQTSGPYIKKLARLMHLVTKIDGRFPSSFREVSDEVFEVLHRMHPTPAVCGLPREKTQTEIRELEGFDRGLFAGPLGWFSTEAAEFCVAIRSAVLHDNELTAYAGSGIVAGSESKSEWEETELKMSALTDLFAKPHAEARPYANCRKVFYSHNVVKEDSGDGEGEVSLVNQKTIYVEKSAACENMSKCNIHLSRSSLSYENDRSNLLSATRDSVGAEVNLSRYRATDALALYLLPNLNSLWALCCIEELCRNGIDTFFIAPGSRSAPLAVAAVTSRHSKYFVSHDERGAGFLAVGFARATSRAAAVITSSGTAVANLLPAAVEASADSLPLILLTADRPPELRHVGANQTIKQVGIFGSYVLWSNDVPCPTEEIPLRYLLKNVDLAVRMSGSSTRFRGLGHTACPTGPVHINMMFRENLAPDDQAWNRQYITTAGSRWCNSLNPAIVYGFDNSALRGVGQRLERKFCPSHRGFATLLEDLRNQKNGAIIIAGGSGSIRTNDEAAAVREIVAYLNWPIISDICGGIRICREFPNLTHYADLLLCSTLLKTQMSFPVILQFGERIASKRLLNMIQESSHDHDNFVHVIVSPSLRPSDPSLTVTHRIEADIPIFLAVVKENSSVGMRHQRHGSSVYLKMNEADRRRDSSHSRMGKLKKMSELVDGLLNEVLSLSNEDQLTEPHCARIITENLPGPSALFIGNSMPIRDFDCFAATRADGHKLQIAANRGASGIDGLLSTGIGFGIGLNMDVTVVVGDMSMIHDLNALHLLRERDSHIPVCVTVVVINNGGGGIFSMLPIAKHRDLFSPVFDTPHDIGFKQACSMFGIDYIPANTVSDLLSTISTASERHRVIEALVSKDHGLNANIHKRIAKLVDERIDSVLVQAAPGTSSLSFP